MSIAVAFFVGLFVMWAFNRIVWKIATRQGRFAHDVRKGMYANLDYDALMRLEKQLDAELARRRAPS